MNETNNAKIYSLSKVIVLIATMSALLIVGKISLALVPNIEVVTTLVIVFAYVFGWYAIGATAIFCAVDMLLYPTTPDVVISYFIYWNLLALLAAVLRKGGIKTEVPYLILGLVMTIFFGFLPSLAESLMTQKSFWPLYFKGTLFYLAHFVSTLVFMSVGFKPLTETLLRIFKDRI